MAQSDELVWYGSRAVLITPMNNLLLYGTGGFAYGGVKSSASLVLTPATDGNYAGSTSETKTVWTVGVGGEYIFASNWSVKLESYLDLGSTDVRMLDPGGPGRLLIIPFIIATISCAPVSTTNSIQLTATLSTTWLRDKAPGYCPVLHL